MKLILELFKKIGTSLEPYIPGDGLNSIPIGQTTPAAGAFTTLKASTDPTDDNGVGDRGYNDTRYLISAIPMDTVTDPALNAAVSTAIIDVYSGIIITLTAAGNAQTLQSPTDTTAGKRFVVVTDDGNGANTIEVNGITMSAGEAQRFIWDGSAWMPVTAVDADDISFTPAGNIIATDVQAAIEEVDTEKLAIASNLSDVNDAATSFGNIKQGATESATGVVEKATTAECVTGTDTDRVVTPAGLTARMAEPGEIGGTTPAKGTFTSLESTNARFVKVTTVNATTYDLLTTDEILSVTYTTTGPVTSLTLPTAQSIVGRLITVKDAGYNAGTNNITIDTEGAEKVDNGDTFVINADGDSVDFYSDGTDWHIR